MFDIGVLLVLTLGVLMLILVAGIVTLGLGFLLYALPIVPLVAIAYVGATVGSPAQATLGMRLMNLRLERLDGRPVDPVYAIVHSVVFWLSVSALTPFVLLIGLFTDRRQLGHDLLLNTVMVRARV